MTTRRRFDREFKLQQGESTFIPLGKKHRLENKTDELLEIIEVQTGHYLGEDDIVRFSDKYGSFELCKVINKKDHDRLLSFLRSSLSTYGEKRYEEGRNEAYDGPMGIFAGYGECEADWLEIIWMEVQDEVDYETQHPQSR